MNVPLGIFRETSSLIAPALAIAGKLAYNPLEISIQTFLNSTTGLDPFSFTQEGFVMKKHGQGMLALLAFLSMTVTLGSAQQAPAGFTSLFNGRDFSGWKVPEGDNGHWKILDGVIDYDAESEAPRDKNLWTEREYGDFVLRVDWRIKDLPYTNPNVPIILPSGLHKKNNRGEEIKTAVPDSDSGILLRGAGKSQINIWNWPVGSGEVYGYRMDKSMPPEVRAGVTPKKNMDRDVGEWNTFEITMQGDRLTVRVNGEVVIERAQLPGIPPRGRIGLQHHGAKRDGKWTSPPALVQFRNIYIKEL